MFPRGLGFEYASCAQCPASPCHLPGLCLKAGTGSHISAMCLEGFFDPVATFSLSLAQSNHRSLGDEGIHKNSVRGRWAKRTATKSRLLGWEELDRLRLRSCIQCCLWHVVHDASPCIKTSARLES